MANQPPLTQAAVDDITTNIMQARQNMLDATIEAAALKRAPNLSRVLYVGKIPAEKWPETSKERVREWHETVMKGAGMVTKMYGFLMVYPTCVLHMLEAETAVLMHVVRALRGEGKLEPILEGVCVLSFTEMVAMKVWPAWMSTFVKSDNLGPYVHEGFHVIRKISEVNINLLKAGRIFSDLPKDDLPGALESLRHTVEDLVVWDPNEIWKLQIENQSY
ncbi:uncharacterized protein [Physcomitrium patens]|uniref:uncharacterized protein isoform X2 n=1 Tax=Physcomitrium patens TaxID=3218 RepID=UPI003CCCE00B